MRLGSGGIDIFYVDESMDADVITVSAIAIPFLRLVASSWALVWE